MRADAYRDATLPHRARVRIIAKGTGNENAAYQRTRRRPALLRGSGQGTPVVFVHEYAGDWRTWEPQMRHFSRAHRCVTYSQRGYPPSDVPDDRRQYSQDIFRDDVVAVMDALKIDKAHVVGHSMGA